MDLLLRDKRALVLGSTSGLGRAIASQLVAEHAKVVIAGRDEQRARSVAKEIGSSGLVTGDLGIEGEASRMVDAAAQQLGGLDIIVVNTAGGSPGPLSRCVALTRHKGYESMLRPAMEAALAAVPHLRKSCAGRMLFITARSILEASTDLALSSVYRSAVAAAARSLALELAPDILVNVIVPGQFDTPAYHRFRSWLANEERVAESEISRRHLADIPLRRLGTAEELANVVTFLCSSRASFVTGSVVRVDGGAVTGFH